MPTTHKPVARSLAPLALTAFGLLSTVPALAQQYSLTIPGILPTGQFSYGNAVNNSGQVAGQSNSGGYNGSQLATLYSSGVLSAINPAQSSANSINASGKITGIAQTSAPGDVTVNKAYVYSNGTTTFLPGFGGNFSEGLGINNSGQVVGSSDDANFNTRAFLYSNSQLIDVDKILGGGTNFNDSIASAISNNGKITGTVYNDYAYTYDSNSGIVNFLPSLRDPSPADPYEGFGSFGNAINDSGQVAGSNVTADGNQHAVLYSSTGVETDLTPGLGASSSAFSYGINDGGQVVGTIQPSGIFTSPYAFLFSNGKVTDLNTLIAPGSGFSLYTASGISDNGDITGYGFYQGHIQSFLLTPAASVAPEPSSVADCGIVALFAAGLILKARKRKGSVAPAAQP